MEIIGITLTTGETVFFSMDIDAKLRNQVGFMGAAVAQWYAQKGNRPSPLLTDQRSGRYSL